MRNTLLYAFVVAWLLGTTFIFSKMHGLHFASFENKEVNKHMPLVTEQDWGIVHILADGCGCSDLVAEHLIKRGPAGDADEKVLLLGDTEQYTKKLQNKGFQIINSKEVKGYIEGVPMLIIHNKNGDIKYSGGYANKMITPITPILDMKLFQQVKQQTVQKNFVVRGCAVSRRIQQELDPLGLKYEKDTL